MSSAVILQHVAQEGPGRIVPIFRDYGIPVQTRALFRGDEVPTDLDEVRVLILLGGPISINEVGQAKYPFLEKEVEVLKRLIAADRPVLGIDLGARLLAHAAGAKVYPNARPGATPEEKIAAPEIGWAPVTFPFPGGTEPIVMGLSDGAVMFHWHKETCDLPRIPPPPNAPPPPAPQPPPGNALLSSSRLCKNQAFRFKTHLFGFQYHIQFTEAEIQAAVAAGKEELSQLGSPHAEQTIQEETKQYYPRFARSCERILRNYVQFLKVY